MLPPRLIQTCVSLLLLVHPGLVDAQQRVRSPTDSAGTPCSAGESGTVFLSSRAMALYALELRADSAILTGAIIVRSQEGWRGFYGATRSPPPQPRGGPWAGGGTVDTLWLLINADRHIATIHNTEVPFGLDNVLLVDRVDGVGGPPVGAGTVRVPDTFAHATRCFSMRPSGDSVRALLLRDARIREFVRP
jgi:hypothetical protein